MFNFNIIEFREKLYHYLDHVAPGERSYVIGDGKFLLTIAYANLGWWRSHFRITIARENDTQKPRKGEEILRIRFNLDGNLISSEITVNDLNENPKVSEIVSEMYHEIIMKSKNFIKDYMELNNKPFDYSDYFDEEDED